MLTGAQQQPIDMLKRIDLIPNLVSDEQMFDSFETCIKALEESEPA